MHVIETEYFPLKGRRIASNVPRVRLHDSRPIESRALVVSRAARDEPREVIQWITGERISPINKRRHGATTEIHEDFPVAQVAVQQPGPHVL